MGLQAYQQASQRAESPKSLEYRLFGQVTRALMEAAKLDPRDFSGRGDALGWNRQVWSTLASACSDPENALSPMLRANIISLSLWVSRHSSLVMAGEESFDDLIEVNRMMMQGLSGGSPEGAEAA